MSKKYIQSQFATFWHILIVCSSVVIINDSCRKIDHQVEKSDEPENVSVNKTITERFFTIPETTNENVKAIAKQIVKQNERKPFVEGLVKKIGYPLWDKAMISNSAANRTESLAENSSLLYIPFAIPDSNTTAAVLAVGLYPTDTIFNLLYPQSYQQYGFDTTSSGWQARNVLHLFAEFEFNIFNRTEYLITDGRIFGLAETDTFRLNRAATPLQRIENSTPDNCMLFVPPNYNRQALGTEVFIVPGNSFIVCTSFFLEGGDGPGPLDGGSGGGSGSVVIWPYGEPCPILLRGFGTEAQNLPLCQTGWVPWPIGNNPPPLPPSDSTIAENLKNAYLKVKQIADNQHTAAQNDGNERAFSYQLNNNDTIAYNIVIGNDRSSKPSTGSSIFGLNHTHQDNGLPPTNLQSDANQCFDSDDVFKFYTDQIITAGSKNLKIQTITTRDYVYAAYITNVDLFKSTIVSKAGSSILFNMADNLYIMFDSLMNACVSPPTCTYERKSEIAILNMFGGDNSGIKFFKSPRNLINFTRL